LDRDELYEEVMSLKLQLKQLKDSKSDVRNRIQCGGVKLSERLQQEAEALDVEFKQTLEECSEKQGGGSLAKERVLEMLQNKRDSYEFQIAQQKRVEAQGTRAINERANVLEELAKK
jgi:hypothetical protein